MDASAISSPETMLRIGRRRYAANVLEAWDINTASDIGEIVFDLIDLNILSAADDDKRSDFDIALALTDPVHIRKTTPQMEIPQID